MTLDHVLGNDNQLLMSGVRAIGTLRMIQHSNHLNFLTNQIDRGI
jgi:hypothetical protein